MNEERDSHNTWKQGYFVDGRQYDHLTPEYKRRANIQESFLVRPYPTENAICKCQEPDDAKWIASRLNRAADLEKALVLMDDYIKGNVSKAELDKFVEKFVSENNNA